MYTSVSPPFRSPPSPLSLSRARALSTPDTAMLLVKTCLFINRFRWGDDALAVGHSVPLWTLFTLLSELPK